jgi:hypothetical protein
LCDGDTGRCRFGRSCRDLRDAGVTESGEYALDFDGSSGAFEPFPIRCDMTTDGGGWTEITPAIARNQLNGAVTTVAGSPEVRFEGNRPCSRGGAHTVHYTFDFPPGFQSARLVSFEARANAAAESDAEIDPATFAQVTWDVANDGADVGDIALGGAFAAGPAASFAGRLTEPVSCESCSVPWPAGEELIGLEAADSAFRIGWGEAGGPEEGWCPWWQGRILLR